MTVQVELKIEKFNRKSFPVDVVVVTEENLETLATWCHGEVRSCVDNNGGSTIEKYIKVRVYSSMNERYTKAFVGDRITRSGSAFKVYTPNAFAKVFEPVNGVENNKPIHVEQTQLVFEDGARVSSNGQAIS